MRSGIEVFVSYAHQDKALLEKLEKHLLLLKTQGFIDYWYDRDISGGTEWAQEIDKHLNTAQIILLLVSPDFLASDYCYGIEMERAVARHQSGEVRVIPIILRPVNWRDSLFGKLPALPKNKKPVTTWLKPDEAFYDIALDILQVAQKMAITLSSSVESKQARQASTTLESTNSNRLKELENTLRKSYSYIRGYQDIFRISDDLQQKAQAQQSIERQGILTKHYLSEYQELANQLGVRIPTDIAQISAHLGNMEYRAIS